MWVIYALKWVVVALFIGSAIVLWVQAHRFRVSNSPDPEDTPDEPMGFGYKTAWIAVRSDSPTDVAEALGLTPSATTSTARSPRIGDQLRSSIRARLLTPFISYLPLKRSRAGTPHPPSASSWKKPDMTENDCTPKTRLLLPGLCGIAAIQESPECT